MLPIKRIPGLSCFLILVILLAGGCADPENSRDISNTLRVGVLPDEDRDTLGHRYTPLLDYLSDQLNLKVVLKIPSSYEELVEDFANDQIDIAWFGGVTFLEAHRIHGAVPVVMRDVDLRFTTYFLVRTDVPLNTVEEFKGKVMVFGSRRSTSGHFMPRHYLKERGIKPEEFFSNVQYSGSHDKTAEWVMDGKADIGAANSKIVDAMYESGQLSREQVRILWETPPYPDYVWALQPYYNEKARQQLTQAFLSLSPSIPAHAKILKNVDAGGFLPTSMIEYEPLKKILEESDGQVVQ